jgi:hypothetical protein
MEALVNSFCKVFNTCCLTTSDASVGSIPRDREQLTYVADREDSKESERGELFLSSFISVEQYFLSS